jgi:hypothetical protein
MNPGALAGLQGSPQLSGAMNMNELLRNQL